MHKVVVIGFGFMGITHSINILKSEKLELSAIVEKDIHKVPEKLKQQSGNLSTGSVNTEALLKIPVYKTLDDCLKKEKPDAVHVCLHTDLHYPVVKNALEKGLHVLVEKPFLLDVKKGEELIELAQSKNRVLMVAHVVRFMSPYKKLLEFIENEMYGKLEFLSLHRYSGLPVWGQWKEKQKDFGSSGGALFDLCIHDIDFAAFVLGQPENINSEILPGRLSNHDYLNAIWKYPSKNLLVKIEGGNIFHTGYPFQAGFTAVFEKATIHYSTNNADSIFIDNDSERKSIEAGNLEQGYFDEIELFAESIEKGELPAKFSACSALETIKLCYKHL